MIDEEIKPSQTAELARSLKAARAKMGWTLREAAAKTGISNGYLSLIEQGEVKSPSPRYLRALAENYDLSFERLMSLAGHPSGPTQESSAADLHSNAAHLSHERMALRPEMVSTADTSGASPGSDTHGGRSSASAPVISAPPDDGTNSNLRAPFPETPLVPHSDTRGAEPQEAVERRQLAALVLDDMRTLSADDIAQVRAFIAGLRAARRS
jgi:transcriptional regulator with XRE-family HTH domain